MNGGLFDLSGDVIIVTGGVGLIGEVVCTMLSKRGAKVVVADVDEERGKNLVASIDDGLFYRLDITDSSSVKTVCDSVVDEFGCIDGLVNAAYPRTDNYGQSFEFVGLDDWQENVAIHLGGYFAMTKAVALKMVDTETGGSIVNFGSIYGMQAPDFSVYEGTEMTSPVEYSAIKAAILNLTRYLASYLGPHNIRLNTVSPGGVFDDQDPQFVENYERRVPLGRMAAPEDVAGAVIYLLSDAGSYVTGHNLVVDGGWTVK